MTIVAEIIDDKVAFMYNIEGGEFTFPLVIAQEGVKIGTEYKDDKFILPKLTTEDLINEIVNQAQKLLDNKANERGYNGILSLCTYVTDPDPALSKEGQDGVRWRSQVWSFLKQYQIDISTGVKSLPTSVNEVLDQITPLEWTN